MAMRKTKSKTKAGKKTRSGKFGGYQSRPKEKWHEHARESSGSFDRYTLDNVPRFSARDGTNRIRILPPTWKDADDWGFRLFVHFGVGPDEQSYLCLKEMKQQDCAVCDEVARLTKEGDREAAQKLRAKKRFGAWLIDRKDQSAGPQFWAVPFGVWRDANIAAEDEEGDVLEFDHPDEGYDLLFKKEGSRDRTKYIGIKLSRKQTPISDDDKQQQRWLDFAAENSVPDILKFFPSEYIQDVFSGKVESSSDDEDEEEEDEEDETEEDEEDEEETDDEEEDEEDDDEEEDDEEEETDEDDEEEETDEDDEEEDEDEEDEKPKTRRRQKPKTKPKSQATKRLQRASSKTKRTKTKKRRR